ncbi:Sulfur carrier protein ThiS @ Opine oxidase subunit C [Alloactinosynnema sp. L-07]|uniref:sulfur carrier protein ThiS n=1 Tax=Alloactinosynnema sp. L-07 TaxID=1653480 RepID=UPI00065F0BA7|nr:sulfur carrier protein ThiS [Alloactinosynnema sp. L-07]CRK61240.1 Sulfur carrier protein ThiS @ Opine oxidase subunit C [Alloactinosynnema sp. L-07]
MRIEVNGEPREVADGTTVADVLAALGLPANGIAVAVDGEVVPRADHARTTVTDGAAVEILTAVQGG